MSEQELREKYWEFFNPMYTSTEKLLMAVGAVEFRDRVIQNLRQQIKELKEQNERTNPRTC